MILDLTAARRKQAVVEALTHRADWLHVADSAYRAGVAQAVAMLAQGHSAASALCRGYITMTADMPPQEAA